MSDNRAVRFGILGPIQVSGHGRGEIRIGGPRLRALLARLLLDPGRIVGTDQLVDDLYGADPPAGAANALQSQVSRLRRALADPSLVELHPAGYRLAVNPDQVDAHRFGRLAADGHRALAAGDPARAAAVLRQAQELWRGPALADVRDAPYAPAQAARLAEAWLAAVADRIDAVLALGEPEPLLPELHQLVASHPLRERLHGQLMRALAAAGRVPEALAAYQQARRTLAEELGVDPSPELTALFRTLVRGGGTAPRPADSGLVPPPGQLTSFVGREAELHRAGELLGSARLVTVTGPGGAGKTRLAIEAAARWPTAGEVGFVDLAPLTDPQEVPQAVLDALGVRQAGLRAGTGEQPDPAGRLVAALADRPVLLLLDNCEHLVAAVARLAGTLLAACPRLRVLATSREALGLTGEALLPLAGLPLPPAAVTGPPAVATGSPAREAPAVRLFLDRAADVAPELPAAELPTVNRIVRTLDGLPLAIELAAARLRSLPVAEVAARLDDRFRLLSRGSRTAPPRHRTLWAVVDWSWELLSEPERVLARRLTVFAGGTTLAAVEQVCRLPAGQDPAELLAGLVEKSLVEVTGDRYRMLETIRAYAADRLAEAGEADRLRATHAAYYLDLARTADPQLRRADQLAWLSRLDGERDNLHAALRRAVAAGDHGTALDLVAALAMYWWLRGLRGEAAVLAGELLAAVGRPPPGGRWEQYALCALTAALGAPGGPVAPPDWSFESLLSHLDAPPRQPFLLYLSALAAGPPGDGVAGLETLQARAGEVLGDDPWSWGLQPVGTGMLRLLTGQPDLAERELRTALARFRAIGERWGMMLALASLAELAAIRGEPTAATAVLDEALRLAGELGSTVDTADLLRTRGSLRLRAGDLAGAETDLRQAIDLAGRAGAPEVRAAARLGLGELAGLGGDLSGARDCFQRALAECPTGWYSAAWVRAEAYVALGGVAAAAGDPAAAADWYRRALSVGVPAPAAAIEGLARLALAAGAARRAGTLLGAGAARHAAGLAAPVDPAGVPAELAAQIGEAAYRQAYAEGAALPPDRALDLLRGADQA